MKIEKLFQVLVLGGGLLVAGMGSVQAENVVADESEVMELSPFCKKGGDMCEVDKDGKSTPKKGVVCCWNTTCE